jgi:hypothetical protein
MRSRTVPLDALCALGGPLVIGAIAGMRAGPFAAAHEAVLTPAVLFGVTALMIPALYIVTAFAGIAPAARGFAGAIGEGLRACGVALLGLAAPAAFLVATAQTAEAAALVGTAALCAAALVGLRALYHRLFAATRRDLLHVLVYGCWSLLALLLGAMFWPHGLAG